MLRRQLDQAWLWKNWGEKEAWGGLSSDKDRTIKVHAMNFPEEKSFEAMLIEEKDTCDQSGLRSIRSIIFGFDTFGFLDRFDFSPERCVDDRRRRSLLFFEMLSWGGLGRALLKFRGDRSEVRGVNGRSKSGSIGSIIRSVRSIIVQPTSVDRFGDVVDWPQHKAPQCESFIALSTCSFCFPWQVDGHNMHTDSNV